MSVAEAVAQDLRTSGRSIRRAVNDGLIRAERPTPNKLVVPTSERQYLRRWWPTLSGLRQALRTEPNVLLAVVYGSIARGDADEDSDVDLLIEFKHDDPRIASGVRNRLQRVIDREVGVARLARVERSAPLVLAQVLDEGRVLVDRGGRWPELKSRQSAIERRASAAFAAEMASTRESLDRIERRARAVS